METTGATEVPETNKKARIRYSQGVRTVFQLTAKASRQSLLLFQPCIAIPPCSSWG